MVDTSSDFVSFHLFSRSFGIFAIQFVSTLFSFYHSNNSKQGTVWQLGSFNHSPFQPPCPPPYHTIPRFLRSGTAHGTGLWTFDGGRHWGAHLTFGFPGLVWVVISSEDLLFLFFVWLVSEEFWFLRICLLFFFARIFFFCLVGWHPKNPQQKIALNVGLFDPLEKGHVFCKRPGPGGFSMKRAWFFGF